MTDYNPIWNWAIEREVIRLRRVAGEPPPWTPDPVLRQWRFCNVRREDDTVTRWIDENIRRPYARHPNLWFMLCIARVINWPPTLADLMSSQHNAGWPDYDGWSQSQFIYCLTSRQRHGNKVFTGAYTITAPPAGGSKIDFIARVTLGQLWSRSSIFKLEFINSFGPTLQSMHALIKQFPAWGNFMAYQVVVDMRFCPRLLGEADDIDTWAAAGPGTIRGLNRVHGRPLNHRLKQVDALAEMRDIYNEFSYNTGIEIDFSDVPNILCETDKYLRVWSAEGKPRQRYNPGGDL